MPMDYYYSKNYPIIADSGANFHMFKSLEFFTSMVPTHGYVTLGDGKTKIPIQGIGTVKCIIDEHTLEIPNVRFVPGLSESIYSLLQHIKQPNHGISSSYETGLHITFPAFQTAASVGNDDIYLNVFPWPDNKSSTANISYHSVPTDHVQDQGICRHVSHITSTSIKDMKTSDHLLKELHDYYDDVRQQRKLSLPLPSGFRQQTNLQRMYQSFTPPCKSATSDDQANISTEQTTNISSSTAQTLPSLHQSSEDSCTNNSVESHVPILRCIDKVSSHLPSTITFSEDIIRVSIGFRRIDTIKNHLGHLYQNTVKLDGLPADAVLDLGDVSTLPKVARNTVPVPRPKHFADLIHMDIVFGPEVSIGNVHYSLMFTDRFSRMTWIYPMHNLTSDSIKQLDTFFAHLGIGTPSYTNPDIYTVALKDGSISEYTMDVLSAVPSASTSPSPNLLPAWIKGGTNATLFLTTMSKPCHGTSQCGSNNVWYFYPGKSTEGIELSDLTVNCQALIDTGQLFRGHAKFRNVYNARNQVCLTECVLRHVSAHGLKSLVAPTSLKAHTSMDPGDQVIWNEAYNEEYDGLVSLPTWEVVSEERYCHLSNGRKALPTIAIATIKYDEHNHPKCAKYRLVVLGNLDYHTWSKEDTTTPVLSQLELRLLTVLADHNKRVLKNCDVKQAFIQSSLPSNEEYFLHPPPGCPHSQPGQYWRLLCSLYGLKRAPKLWFTMLSSHLKSMGLQCSSTSPCLFVGTLVEGEPPIYVDL
jgi:hypothetical protein